MWLVALECAAVTGLDLWPLTFRELLAAFERKRVYDWDHTAAIRMEISNSAFGRKRGKKFREFHPFAKNTKRRKEKLNNAESRRLLDAIWNDWGNNGGES